MSNRWIGHGDVRYGQAHERVRTARGKATEHQCVDCGGRADEWSYTGGSPTELVDPGRGPYTLDTAYYVPRCRPCHRKLDAPPRKQECREGHPLVEGNLYVSKANGRRTCRICRNAFYRAARARAREQRAS